jgi:hypothetical protein
MAVAMSLNAFIGKTEQPTEAEVGVALGKVKAVWDELIADLAALDVSIPEWRSYSAKAGWSLRLKRGKRTIVWMSPCEGCLRVAFILGGKAVAAARQGGVSKQVLALIDSGEKYPEGTGVRLEMTSAKDIPTVMKLAEIKLRN